MKKNKILNGLGTKLALAVVALTSSLFTSCEKEDFNATFEGDAAKAIIAVAAYDAETGNELTPSTISATGTGVECTVSGKEITVKPASGKDIAATTVKVTVECNGKTGTGTVKIDNLKAGSVGNYSITFLVGKDGLIGPVEEPAKAIVKATATDAAGHEVEGVTYEFTSTVEGGVAEENVFTITGDNDIAAQKVTVKATYTSNGETSVATATVDIPLLKAGTVNSFYVSFYVIENEIRPELDAAKAVITASAVDVDNNNAAVEGVKFTFVSDAEGGVTVGDNEFVIVGSKNIVAQNVTVTAEYNGHTAETVVAIPDLAAGAIANYSVIFSVSENTIEVLTDKLIETSYLIEAGTPTSVESDRYYLTDGKDHTFNHSHNGIDYWFTNEADYILNARVAYNAYAGYELANKSVTEESDFVNTVFGAYERVSGIEAYQKVYEFEVSAWSIYTAWAQITTTTTHYTIKKQVKETEVKNGIAAEPVVSVTDVAGFDLITKSVSVDHYEAAHPSHSHAYVPGHGHGHGHGSDNAGGGIVMPD